MELKEERLKVYFGCVCVNMSVCMCVCVRERGREGGVSYRDGERERVSKMT